MSTKPDYSRGEPAPIDSAGPSMHDLAIAELGKLNKKMQPIVDLLAERKQFGLDKYKKPLRAHNGRNPYNDILDEIGDALAYHAQAIYEAEQKYLTKPTGGRTLIMKLYNEFWNLADYAVAVIEMRKNIHGA